MIVVAVTRYLDKKFIIADFNLLIYVNIANVSIAVKHSAQLMHTCIIGQIIDLKKKIL